MNKQALTEALEFYEAARLPDYDDRSFHTTLLTAARLVERLLPGECENCQGAGSYVSVMTTTQLNTPMQTTTGGLEAKRVACPVCHGSGRVWDEGIVEECRRAAIKAATDGQPDWLKGIMLEESTLRALHLAVPAVLSAIAQLTEKEEG